MNKLQKECIRSTAQNYLCDELPHEWDKMDEEDLFEFLEENAWEPCQEWAGSFIWDAVTAGAQSQYALIREQLRTLTSDEMEEIINSDPRW